MFFILNISIGGGIWIPFTVGKTAALLTVWFCYLFGDSIDDLWPFSWNLDKHYTSSIYPYVRCGYLQILG